MLDVHNKIKSTHLGRDAYLYIRQSTLKQVVDNQESTKRQYALQDRAIVLGWHSDQVIVIDSDQGQSGAETDREGFQKLVAEVGMGHAGIVMGLEVSRLARNSTDWHRLLEICALSDTLILDEDGVYDPSYFNDRLLLGLKGTMSEAELHILKARLRGGILNKARRGELKLSIPVGFIYDQRDRVILDPNKMVQENIQFFFKTFERTGSAYLTVRAFREKGLKFPRRPCTGPSKGGIIWGELTHFRALRALHNPRYAGIFFYGRTHQIKQSNGNTSIKKVSKDEWQVFLPESHPGYISQEQYELNQRRLLGNAQAYSHDRRKSPPREGPALLQGLIICGICGRRMTLRYHQHKEGLIPDYVCQNVGINHADRICQCIPGGGIDEAVGDILVKMVTPVTLEVALAVQKELESQMKEVERLRKKGVEQASYEADLGRRRYMNVDPENRHVADSLEAEWNEKLRALADAQKEYEENYNKDRMLLDEKQKCQIIALATDFPNLWNDPKTPARERKRMVRLLIEDVTLVKNKGITVHIRFKGGASKTLILPLPLNTFMARKTKPEIVEEVDLLLEKYPDAQIVPILNNKGLRTGNGLPFTWHAVWRIRKTYNLKNYYTRLREKGILTRKEMIKLLNTNQDTLKKWKDDGLIRIHTYGGKPQHILYEPPGKDFFTRIHGDMSREDVCLNNRIQNYVGGVV